MMGHGGGGVGMDGEGGDGSKAGDSLGGGRGRRRKRGRGDPRFRRGLADVRKVCLCDKRRMMAVSCDPRQKYGRITPEQDKQRCAQTRPQSTAYTFYI